MAYKLAYKFLSISFLLKLLYGNKMILNKGDWMSSFSYMVF